VSAVASAALAQLLPEQTERSASPTHRQVAAPLAAEHRASERFAALPSREPIGKARGELFGARSWAPPAAARAAAAHAAAPRVPEKPAAPPNPYRVAGQVVAADGMRIVLAKGDRVFQVRPGETLEDGYRVDSIAPHSVTFTYVPLGLKQELAIAGAALDLASGAHAAASPRRPEPAQPPQPAQPESRRLAQLRFEGPQQVRAGTPFDVALKLTSPQPVRAVPMQLTYDAKRLKPLAVRAGDLFAGGNFTYRVNPSGSIFVGASGNSHVAADTKFLVVTFRPIASGPAELKVSSLLLQGAAGRTIVHEPPQTFRAAIVR
jgi:hypothetical protein